MREIHPLSIPLQNSDAEIQQLGLRAFQNCGILVLSLGETPDEIQNAKLDA
jgi:hypothetical protein